MLRFSKSGNATIEQLYRTHWISGELSKRKRERLVERVSRAAELVVIQPLQSAWTCHRCGGTGDLLIMENPGPALLAVRRPRRSGVPRRRRCVAHAPCQSEKFQTAVVVRFSRSRRRYERQGLLVEPRALTEAQRELADPTRQLKMDKLSAKL
jgi:hypothetical protein